MAGRRGSSGFGINPVSWSDIDAFVRNSGMKLAPWEVEVIEMLDDLFLAEQARQTKGGKPESQEGSGRG